MGRMAVVGCEASGKTVFLSALADLYQPRGTDPAALCLMPENQAANRFAAFQRRQMRSLRQWPPATNPGKALRMDWTLRAGGQKITDISMLEFGGETFRAAFRESEEAPAHREAVQALLDYLSEADFIVVLVSIKELLRDPGTLPAEQFERDTESVWVTRGLLNFIRTRLPGAGTVIGLTQADRYAAELSAAGGAAGLLSARWPTIGVLAQEIPVVPVASVSATDAEGRPAEGYTTEGVVPVIRELARQSYGEPTALRGALEEMGRRLDGMKPARDLAAYQTLSARFGATIEKLATSVALTRGAPDADITTAQARLARYRAAAEEAERKAVLKRAAQQRRGRSLRTLLLALLVLSGAAAVVSVLMLPEVSGSAPGGLPAAAEKVVVVTNTVVVPVIDPLPRETPPATLLPTLETTDGREDSGDVVEAKPEEAPAVETNRVTVAEEPAAETNRVVAPVVEITPEEAERQRKQRIFDKCRREAEAGDAKAKRILAGHYLQGSDFVSQDILRAQQLYREAAEAGDAKAMYHVGLDYFDIIGSDPLARGRAHDWFLKAKAAGCPAADLDDLIEQTK